MGFSMSFLLIQPAEPHRGGQVYLPGGLLNLAGRLIAADQKVTVIDLNLDRLERYTKVLLESSIVCITVLGKPYIPGTIDLIRQIRATGFEGQILIGGQAVECMLPARFNGFFGSEVTRVCSDEQLNEVLNLDLPNRYKAGMELALAQLHPQRRRRYLTNEFGLWLSNGCSQDCSYCDALNGVPEKYRHLEALKQEVRYVCDELCQFGHDRLEMYLSNLDGFQPPKRLEAAMQAIHKIASAHGLEVRVRCLSTVAFFNKAIRKDGQLLERLRGYGLRIVAFGADGADPRVWARENKRHNTLKGLHTALEDCLDAGIDPEILMVIGFNDDDLQSMRCALREALYWADRGVVIRPYVGKPILKKLDEHDLVPYLDDPTKLLSLDYAGLASRVTHPSRRQRYMVNTTYLLLIGLLTPVGRNTTFPTVPIEGGRVRRSIARTINRFMPFDR